MPVFEPHAFPNIIRCNWFPHSSVVENAFGCQSACAQTALPPGPAFGAASAYEKCILDDGNVKLGWGFVKPIARKTNERFRSLRYSLHAGGGLCMQHPGPRNGAAILEAFPSSGNIAAPFLGPVFGPIFGTTKEQTGAARRS